MTAEFFRSSPNPDKVKLPTQQPAPFGTQEVTLMDLISALRSELAATQAQVATLTKALVSHQRIPAAPPAPKAPTAL